MRAREPSAAERRRADEDEARRNIELALRMAHEAENPDITQVLSPPLHALGVLR